MGFFYLFTEPYVWCSKPIPLAIDGRVCTPSNGIHLPMGVVIVHHMEISMPTSEKVTKKQSMKTVAQLLIIY